MPEKVDELVERWWEEAARYGVLPLDDRTIELFAARYRDHSPHPADRHYIYFPPMSPAFRPEVAPAPRLAGLGHRPPATIERAAGESGVLFASGTENSGVSLFVQDDHLVLDYNFFGDHQIVVSERRGSGGALEARRPVPPQGPRRRDQPSSVDDAPSGSVVLPFAMTIISSVGASVGYDDGSAVSERYRGPFPFEGRFLRLDVTAPPARGRRLGRRRGPARPGGGAYGDEPTGEMGLVARGPTREPISR